MSTEEIKNDRLQIWMKESLVDLPFSDFEDRTMQKIFREEKSLNAIYKDIKLSYVFFVLGTVVGLLIALLLSNNNQSIGGLSLEAIRLTCQIASALLFILLVNCSLSKTRKYKLFYH